VHLTIVEYERKGGVTLDGKELKVGDAAPDFTLKDHHGKEITLSGFRGRKVVLGFHPLAWTSVCAQQMKDLEANSERMEKSNAVAFGVSVDSTFCKKAWAASLGIEKTPLVADFWKHGEVAGKYGIFDDGVGTSKRAAFILDERGTVRFAKVYPTKQVPDIDEIMTELEKI
jgi:peroxiredoxin